MILIYFLILFIIVIAFIWAFKEEKWRKAQKELDQIGRECLLKYDSQWNKLVNGGWKDLSKEELEQIIAHCNRKAKDFDIRMGLFEKKYFNK